VEITAGSRGEKPGKKDFQKGHNNNNNNDNNNNNNNTNNTNNNYNNNVLVEKVSHAGKCKFPVALFAVLQKNKNRKGRTICSQYVVKESFHHGKIRVLDLFR
jgi:hypothetical protein